MQLVINVAERDHKQLGLKKGLSSPMRQHVQTMQGGQGASKVQHPKRDDKARKARKASKAARKRAGRK
jgi:hypothetical protein